MQASEALIFIVMFTGLFACVFGIYYLNTRQNLAMIEKGIPSGETYHLGSGETTWCQFARTTMEHCATLGLPSAKVQPIPTEQWPTKAERPRNSVLDSRKFLRDFGYSMPDWRESVRAVIERLANSPTT